MKKAILVLIMCMAILTGCGTSSSDAAEQTESVQTVTTTEGKEEATVTDVTTTVQETTAEAITTVTEEPEYTEEDVKAAQTWMTKIWNICVDVESYAHRGTDCTGKEMDIEFYIKGAELEYKKRDEYDAAVHALDDSVPEQEMFILAWDKSIEQADMLIEKAFSDIPTANDENYEFNLDLFRQYSEQLRYSMNDMLYDNTDKPVATLDDKKELVFKK